MQITPPLVKATAAAPTLAEGELTYPSVNLAGSLRTVGGGGTSDMNLLQVGGTAITLGQKAMAASLPIVIASDQSAVAISAASLPLPSGAATAALQLPAGHAVDVTDRAARLLGVISAGSNVIGALTANQSINTVQLGGIAISLNTGVRDTGTQRVTIATNDLVPISAAALPLPAGAATSAAQLPAGHNVTVIAPLPALVAGSANIGDVDVASVATSFGKTITYVSVNQVSAGTTVLAAASVGNNHKVVASMLVMSLTGTLKFTDDGGDLTGPMDIATNGGFVTPAGIMPYFQTGATNRALNLVTTLGAARGVVAILTEA